MSIPTRYSLDQLAGEPITIEFGGKEYKAAPITVGDYAAFENHCRQRRVKAFLASADGTEAATVQTVCLRLLSGSFSEFDIQKELDTFEGARFMLHRSLCKHQPDLKIEDVDGTITGVNHAA